MEPDVVKAQIMELTVTRTFSYDLAQISEEMTVMNDEAPTEQDVLDLVTEYVYEDIRMPLSGVDIKTVVTYSDGSTREVSLNI
jgi:hypothetical protein